ncbi:MAG: hypothetical protein ACHBN1_21640 [Heteroscytonema crispum UTEX LB 1556]
MAWKPRQFLTVGEACTAVAHGGNPQDRAAEPTDCLPSWPRCLTTAVASLPIDLLPCRTSIFPVHLHNNFTKTD